MNHRHHRSQSQGGDTMNESALTINKPIFYSKLELAPSVNDSRRLVFVVPTGAPKPPDEILLLRQDYERTARVAAVLFEDEPATRIEIFKLMHEAADRLRGSNCNIEDGQPIWWKCARTYWTTPIRYEANF
jgi:hypothetical protein